MYDLISSGFITWLTSKSVYSRLQYYRLLLSSVNNYMQFPVAIHHEPYFSVHRKVIFSLYSWQHMYVHTWLFCSSNWGTLGSLMGGGNMLTVSCVVDPEPNQQVISLQMCGNGIVENGEDCDPGFNVTSNCCNSATCKFTPGAVCDPASSPCCTAQCSFAPSTQVCRPAKDSRCDSAEMCTGNSSTCPPDHFASNGEYLRQ
jgi:hypothetical protein